MRPIVIDQVAWSVYQSVTVLSPAKTAELPFALRIQVGPTNQVLDGVQITPWEGAVWG